MFDIEDRIAEEVVQAHAQLEATAEQVGKAETDLRESTITFAGNLRGHQRDPGQRAVAATGEPPAGGCRGAKELNRAYQSYFAAVNSYNRAQFQLYRAMGYPARILSAIAPSATFST